MQDLTGQSEKPAWKAAKVVQAEFTVHKVLLREEGCTLGLKYPRGLQAGGGPNRVLRGQLMLQILEEFLADRQMTCRLVPLAPPSLMVR